MAPRVSVIITKDAVAQTLKDGRSLMDFEAVVGLPGSTADRGEDINNPSLGYIHEYGSPANNIPPRPFLQAGVESELDQIVAIFEKGARSALEGNKGALTNTLGLVGNVGQSAVRAKIAAGPFAPLKPTTIRRKGSSKPLIDEGKLREAIAFEIRRKDSNDAGRFNAAIAMVERGVINIVNSNYGRKT